VKPPQKPLDQPLEEAVADTIASDLIDGNIHVLNRRDLARRAAMEGFRQAIELVTMVVGEMAADHEQGGDRAGTAALREAEHQIRTLPADLP
jgi:hypothetical protein